MIKFAKPAVSCLLLVACAAHAAPYTGPDYSGVYECTGDDAADGKYTGRATLALVRAHSSGGNGAYDFRFEAPNFGAYPGEGASQGAMMAIRFANTDPKTQDYGTGIAVFKKNKAGKWTFRNYYYEPAYKAGNHGTEDCVQR